MSEMRAGESRELYRGKVLNLTLERAELPNGVACDLEIIRHMGAAAVLPLTEDGEVILVRQYRHATGGWLLEIPAGKLDDGEQPDACGRRELVEEAGVDAGRLEPLGWIWTTPGFADERIWLFLATQLRPARQQLEHDEVLTVERLPLARAVEMAASGEIVDGKTVCALLRAAHRLDSAS